MAKFGQFDKVAQGIDEFGNFGAIFATIGRLFTKPSGHAALAFEIDSLVREGVELNSYKIYLPSGSKAKFFAPKIYILDTYITIYVWVKSLVAVGIKPMSFKS